MLDIVLSLLGSCIPAVPPGSLYDLTFREMSVLCLVVDSVVLTVNPSVSHGQGFPVSVPTLERDAATWKVVPNPPSLGLAAEAIETFISWLFAMNACYKPCLQLNNPPYITATVFLKVRVG